MNRRSPFTLVEILVVIGIVTILAGLILGAVSISQASGRNTQAKADMASIIMAMRAVENTYGRVVNAGTASFDGNAVDVATSQNSNDTWEMGCNTHGAAYDSFIAELSVPNNSGLSSRNINNRRVVFLEPKADFDPSQSYSGQTEKLWRDPWGNRYRVYINIQGEKYLTIGSKTIAADIALYSTGANGVNDNGCNSELDQCEQVSGTMTQAQRDAHKMHDDIASWRK